MLVFFIFRNAEIFKKNYFSKEFIFEKENEEYFELFCFSNWKFQN
jgi:hypothetical protein